MRICVIGTVPKANGKAGSRRLFLLKIGKFRRKSRTPLTSDYLSLSPTHVKRVSKANIFFARSKSKVVVKSAKTKPVILHDAMKG